MTIVPRRRLVGASARLGGVSGDLAIIVASSVMVRLTTLNLDLMLRFETRLPTGAGDSGCGLGGRRARLWRCEQLSDLRAAEIDALQPLLVRDVDGERPQQLVEHLRRRHVGAGQRWPTGPIGAASRRSPVEPHEAHLAAQVEACRLSNLRPHGLDDRVHVGGRAAL